MSKKIRDAISIIGTLILGLGYLSYLAVGLIGLVICYDIARTLFGRFAAFLGIILFPITLAVSPLLALLKWGTWKPLAIIYGGAITATLIIWLGNTLKEKFEEFEDTGYGEWISEIEQEEKDNEEKQ